MKAATKGIVLYNIYKGLSYVLSPIVQLHIRWRCLRGLEHRTRWTERIGRPSRPRPPGPLLWFHAVSLGEGMAAIPVIKMCVEKRPDLIILMTTTTLSAFEVLKSQLPSSVLYQFSPLDTPAAMNAFFGYWKPNAVILMESELWPNLIMTSSRKGIPLALLNARMSVKSFRRWSTPFLLPLISLMLSKFSLIVPLSSKQGILLQLLQAPPFIFNFSGDLKFVVEQSSSVTEMGSTEDLKYQLANRHVWMASSIHKGEEKIILGVHRVILELYPDLVTIIVPRYTQHGKEIAQELQNEGQGVALRSKQQSITKGTNVYVVDTLGELRDLYKLTPIAVIGGSFLPELAGHNISEAAAAGCAVLTGYHVGHFPHMVKEMRRLNPLSVLQVSGKQKLEEAILKLFRDAKALEAHRVAAKQVFNVLFSGILSNVWNLLEFHIFRQIVTKQARPDENNKQKGRRK